LKSKRKKLIEQLDRIFSRWVRLSEADDNGYVACCTCGTVRHWKEVDAGHWISRGVMAVRWEEWNVWPQCKSCNMPERGGGMPFEYRDFLIAKYGTRRVNRLAERRHEIHQWTCEELEAKIVTYKAALKAIPPKGEK